MAEKECEFSLFTRPIEFAYRRKPPAEFSLTKKSLDIKTPNFRLPNKRALQPGAGALERPNLKHFEFIKCFILQNESDTHEGKYIPENRNNGWIFNSYP